MFKDKQLGYISDLAVQNYSLDEIFEELELPHSLLDDDEVIEAFNAGLIHIFINKKVDGVIDEYIIEDTEITQDQCDEWNITYAKSILLQRLAINTETKEKAQEISSPMSNGIKNIITQSSTTTNQGITQALDDNISSMVEKMKAGDTTDILTVLTTNMLQNQHFNGRVTRQMEKDMSYENWERLSKMQMKLLQESRKTAMAINEICNPKRTTFVKNATQNNILNSEKKSKLENEKQNALETSSQPIDSNTEILEAEYVEK